MSITIGNDERLNFDSDLSAVSLGKRLAMQYADAIQDETKRKHQRQQLEIHLEKMLIAFRGVAQLAISAFRTAAPTTTVFRTERITSTSPIEEIIASVQEVAETAAKASGLDTNSFSPEAERVKGILIMTEHAISSLLRYVSKELMDYVGLSIENLTLLHSREITPPESLAAPAIVP